METSASQEKVILQSADQPHKDLLEEVSNKLNQAGHKTTVQSINPHDQSPLKNIQEMLGDTTHVVGSTFEERVSGASITTHDRTTGGEEPISIARKRSGLKKAA